MQVIVCDNYDKMSREAAAVVANQLKKKPNSVLGLATGSTPVGMYEQLIRMCADGEISFAEAVTYNLDEYYPLSPDHVQSYRFFMNRNLFDKVDINKANTHIPNGLAKDPDEEGDRYDKAVEAAGFIDLQVLGVGQNGHIGFNEPEDELYEGTHLTSLTQDTINANSRFFMKTSDVPTRAITMGMGSILKAKKILVLASGKNKHFVVSKMLSGRITTAVPATLLQTHRDVILICDKAAYEG